ncbi:hypothetical protein BC829DRAFT_408552 [Chytridium lagenaria]|nr:hypothetical protein BC829DRAFT_408552 [Chytridium lagenaria]
MSRPVFVEKAAAVDAGRRSPNVRRKDIQKCIFGVGCANAKSGKCQYYHANEVCKFYPNCKYGSGCIYVHPNPVVA